MILDKIVSVKYLKKNATDSDLEEYVANVALSNVKINIQPASEQTIALTEGVIGQSFTAFTTQSGLNEGNIVTVSGTSTSYIIRGISDWSAPNLIPHYEMVLEKVDE